MKLNEVRKIYLLGIGGIGMSALARYFLHQGVEIYGYDLTPSPLTRKLENEGINIRYHTNTSDIPVGIDLVIYTPAIPKDNEEFIYFYESGIPFYKRSEIVGLISQEMCSIAIAGTHGKTSISALTAHMLFSAGKKITALVGGIMKNYESNLVVSDSADYFVIEADEYDRSFLQLNPDIAVISSVDADHLDVYGSKDHMKEGFKLFAENRKCGGTLIINENVSGIEHSSLTYGFADTSNIRAVNIHISNGKFVFDLETETTTIKEIRMVIPGHHYIENALAAAAIGLKLGLDNSEIKSGLESFNGVERRFDVRISNKNLVYIDDYAHHPEEINATIKAIRLLYPDKKITGIFQPHLFSRTRDFADEFAKALENLDEIILMPIYPAREKPIAGISSEIIYNKIQNQNKKIKTRDELISFLKSQQIEVLLTIGAGDIGLLVNELDNLLKQ